MDTGAVDLDMGDDPYGNTISPASSLAVQEWLDNSCDPASNLPWHATPEDLSSDTTFSDTELTPHYPGEQAAQQNQTPPATPRFNPAALLNPKAAAKRPASSGEEAERGRSDPAIAGQVSLVERLHNVQERTASPAKRVKTIDEQQRKKAPSNGAHFGGGSALDLNKTGQTPGPLPTQVDLTMSKFPGFPSILSLDLL
jgi:hypothetical protein